jgi:hypothetical protein
MIDVQVSKHARFTLADKTPTHPNERIAGANSEGDDLSRETKVSPTDDNQIHVFTQFFIHSSSPQRNIELQHCLYRNSLNPHITKIHLLNEKIYTNEELYGSIGSSLYSTHDSKVVQVNINKRLTFRDVFRYIRESGIYGYCVLTNADIFFDSTIQNVLYSSISREREVFALLRYEFRGEIDLSNTKIFGPRFDSQDTWIIHRSKNEMKENTQIQTQPTETHQQRQTQIQTQNTETHQQTQIQTQPIETHQQTQNTETSTQLENTKGTYIKESQEKAFDFEFGRPGCDNKISYLLNVLGYQVINDPRFIKTYHYHTETARNYTCKDVLPQPYTLLCPAGFNPYSMPSSLGVNIKNVIESTNGFQHVRFDDNGFLYNYIKEKLDKKENFIIPRISGHENNFAFFGKVIQQNIASHVKPTIPNDIQGYFQQTIPIMKRNAGIRISNLDSIINYSNMYLRAFENCEIYGGWESWGHYIPHIAQSHQFIRNNFSNKKIFWVFAMDIYHYIYSRPFTTALKGKRILIVSPFEDSIRAKLGVRSQIYDGVDLFPDCSFVFIKPPVTNGDNISDEFDIELMRFYVQLNELRGKYDVALLSCGGYANPIANYIYENHGASAIYVGGVLQMYFGIYGGRWLKERGDILKLFMNEHWSRPSAREKPNNFTSIENGCYW